MRSRTRRGLGLLGAVALLVGACGSVDSPTAAPSQGESASPSATAADGGSADFRFAVDGEPTFFSPASSDEPTSWINRLLYTGLYRVNNHGDIVPDLATALPDVGPDGLTLTIRLRPDATWHDGSQVTSADAKFTFDLAMSPRCSFNPATCATWGDHVQAVAAPAPDTVVITLKSRWAPIYELGLTQALVPKAATEASYAKLVAGLAAVDAAGVEALADRISAARHAAACASGTPPATCDASSYTADIEASLGSAGIALPDKARFVDADGTTDAAAYGQAVLDQLTDLAATLRAGKADKLAAAYRLLDVNRQPIGSGPYRFVRAIPGDSVELARFDRYYLFKPGPARILVKVITDAAAASQALQSGAIDWQTEIPPDALSAVSGNPDIRLSEYAERAYVFLAFNVRAGRPFADPVAREAFAMCIDHAATVREATGGGAAPINANVPPGAYFSDPAVPDYRFDVAGAKTLLESSGYTLGDGVYGKGGTRLEADLYVSRDRPDRVKFAQLVKSQVAQCGIAVTVSEADYATAILPLLYYPNDFDLYVGGWLGTAEPDDPRFFGCAAVTAKDRPFDEDTQNFTGYCDPKLDKLLAASSKELDRAKRKSLLGQVQLYLHDNGPYYFAWANLGHRGYRVNVATNGELGPIDYGSPYDWWNIDSWVVRP